MKCRTLLLAAAPLLAAGEAGAFCIENAIQGRVVQAMLAPPGPPRAARLFSAPVEFGKQSCCNPRNAECNPDNVPDDGALHFRARIEAAGPARAVTCGAWSDPQQPVLYAPARGYLRFEVNAAFKAQRPPSLVNPSFVVRVLDIDRRPIVELPCA